LVERADFIVNSTPLTRETTGLFNAALLAHMRRGAFFFNVGRGKSVVTEDLISALRSGRIAGAGLDVVDPEPLPKDSPLWTMRNVLITAHVGDESEQKEDRSWQVMRENLRRYAKGEELLTVVDVSRGY
jgi:phosphoglycerate dehydrogenase-like enzyme